MIVNRTTWKKWSMITVKHLKKQIIRHSSLKRRLWMQNLTSVSDTLQYEHTCSNYSRLSLSNLLVIWANCWRLVLQKCYRSHNSVTKYMGLQQVRLDIRGCMKAMSTEKTVNLFVKHATELARMQLVWGVAHTSTGILSKLRK